MPVAAAATAMLWRLIILPMTPPLELRAAISTGSRPRRFGRHDLQVAEERVGRGVAAGEEHAQPAQHGAEEGEQHAGGGEGEAERAVAPE